MKSINDLNEFKSSLETAVSECREGYVIAMLTDKFQIVNLKKEAEYREALGGISYENLFRKAIEIRVFDKNKETKLFRSGIGEEFRYRKIEDQEGEDELSHFDEKQYLDIDEKRSRPKEGIAYTTGGGKYPLPLDDCKDVYGDVKIQIRNYLEYDPDTMRVSIADWRLVEFVREEN